MGYKDKRQYISEDGEREMKNTLIIFTATNLKPFCSKRLIMSAISPLWTPSGLIAMNVLSSDIFTRARDH